MKKEILMLLVVIANNIAASEYTLTTSEQAEIDLRQTKDLAYTYRAKECLTAAESPARVELSIKRHLAYLHLIHIGFAIAKSKQLLPEPLKKKAQIESWLASRQLVALLEKNIILLPEAEEPDACFALGQLTNSKVGNLESPLMKTFPDYLNEQRIKAAIQKEIIYN